MSQIGIAHLLCLLGAWVVLMLVALAIVSGGNQRRDDDG